MERPSQRIAQRAIAEIRDITAALGRRVRLMEVCGTHTVALRKSGVLSLLPDAVEMVSGPGCPVCVTPAGYVDNALCMIRKHDAQVVTFGDMAKVPSTDGETLAQYMGTPSLRLVYSPAELLALPPAESGPYVFLGIGFETTAPTVASVFRSLRATGREDVYLYAAFKAVPPILRTLIEDPTIAIHGFLLPGHVSVIIGTAAYAFLEGPGGIPGVIAGFEPGDMLAGLLMLLRQVREGAHRVENAYRRAVRDRGNEKAVGVMHQVLKPCDAVWRGLGRIPGSGLSLRGEYAVLDAEAVFSLPSPEDRPAPGCRCGDVIQGKALPAECPLFASACTPDHAVGPCMVSSEGTCAAYLRYRAA
jgi:hydrogenase expression/formation protein HypD